MASEQIGVELEEQVEQGPAVARAGGDTEQIRRRLEQAAGWGIHVVVTFSDFQGKRALVVGRVEFVDERACILTRGTSRCSKLFLNSIESVEKVQHPRDENRDRARDERDKRGEGRG